MIDVRQYGFILVDRYGEVLPQCAGRMKTLFKVTMKLRRRLECHVEQTRDVEAVNFLWKRKHFDERGRKRKC